MIIDLGFPLMSNFGMLTRNLYDWKYKNIWSNTEEYLNSLSSLKNAVGGFLGKKIERKASIDSCTCSSVVYPRIQYIMVTIYLALSEKIVAKNGGLSARI